MKLNIKKYRLLKHMSLEELSNRTGFSKSYLDKVENNLENPTQDVKEEIAIALGVCPKMLVESCKFSTSCKNCKLNIYL